MKYHQIHGPMVFQPTGYVGNCDAELKSGHRLLDEFDSTPIDAPEEIPAGSVHCIEWDSTFDKSSKSWFASQRISLRGRQ